MAFGRGIHHCLGAPLALLEGRIVIEMLLDRFASMRLLTDRPRFRNSVVLGDTVFHQGSVDAEFRSAAFSWLAEQAARYGEVIPRGILQAGFVHRGEPVTFMGQPGIWKPRVLELPLSITSVPSGPYDDSFTQEGFLAYRYYRGTDPQHRDNVGLRELCRTRTPLVYFHGVARGRYMPVWPVFIVEDRPHDLCCMVAVEAAYGLTPPEGSSEVMGSDQNGLCLCKIHHAAYDNDLIGISPDYAVHVRQDVREETDGPMLLHGLQELHESTVTLPNRRADRPHRDRLAWRYERFRAA